MNISNFKNKNIYLSPKNDITEFYNKYLISEKIHIRGYIDNNKKEQSIIDKSDLKNDDIILVYSPNHWQEIIKTLPKENLYILYNKNNSLELMHHSKFISYTSIFKIDVNTNFTQKVFWANHLMEHLEKNDTLDEYGFLWGDPENKKDDLGNYLKIKTQLKSLITKNTTILELGTLGGKWTKYMFDAKHIICVDINSYFIDVIKERYPKELNTLEFYISKGNELNGVKTSSVDVVFCIDTLVRVEKEYIFDYIKEIARILKKDGKAIIHLPNSDIEDCRNRNFTNLTEEEIKTEIEKHFSSYILDSNTIIHGTFVKIGLNN